MSKKVASKVEIAKFPVPYMHPVLAREYENFSTHEIEAGEHIAKASLWPWTHKDVQFQILPSGM